jgi:DNA-binding NtrC family response regulator
MQHLTQQRTHQGHRGLVHRGLPTHRQRAIRILMIDDNLADVELCLQELKRAQFAVSADVIQTPAEFTDRLRKKSYDVVLADTATPKWTGLQALALLQALGQEIPFILVT